MLLAIRCNAQGFIVQMGLASLFGTDESLSTTVRFQYCRRCTPKRRYGFRMRRNPAAKKHGIEIHVISSERPSLVCTRGIEGALMIISRESGEYLGTAFAFQRCSPEHV